MMSPRAALALVALTSCAEVPVLRGPPKLRAAAAASAPSVPRAPRRIALEYAIGDKPFPLPLARVTVGGVPALALVDTGANGHVIAGWLARRAKLAMTSVGDSGTDHAGRRIEAMRTAGSELAIEGWGRPGSGPLLVADVPDALERLGIGVFLSPQQLAVGAAPLWLDLRERELREVPDAAELEALSRGMRPLTERPARACIDDAGEIVGRAFVVSAKIGGISAELLLDTGAQHTDLLRDAPAAAPLWPRSDARGDAVYAASGKITPRVARGVQVTVGVVSRSLDVDLVPGARDGFCARDGALAMDVLEPCALVLRPDDVRVWCR